MAVPVLVVHGQHSERHSHDTVISCSRWRLRWRSWGHWVWLCDVEALTPARTWWCRFVLQVVVCCGRLRRYRVSLYDFMDVRPHITTCAPWKYDQIERMEWTAP